MRITAERLLVPRLAPSPVFHNTVGLMKRKSSAKSSRNPQPAIRPHSSLLLDGPERAAARAMLYPVSFTEEVFKKPIVGVAPTGSNITLELIPD
jgi:hypothetical protein